MTSLPGAPAGPKVHWPWKGSTARACCGMETTRLTTDVDAVTCLRCRSMDRRFGK